MSLRAELVRLALRWFIKRKTSPEGNGRDGAAAARAPQPPGACAAEGNAGASASTSTGSRPSPSQPANGRTTVTCLYFHGGGHVAGSPLLYRDFIWRIAAATRARVFILDHRLAPEHPFPAALDDAAQSLPAADGRRRRSAANGGDGRVLGRRARSCAAAQAARRGRCAAGRSRRAFALDRSGAHRPFAAAQRRGRSDDPERRCVAARALLPRRRRSAHALCLSALRRSDRIAANADSGRKRRGPARRFRAHGGAHAGGRMSESSSKYGRGCRMPGSSGRGSFRKRARPSRASGPSCRAGRSRSDTTPSRPWPWRGADARRGAA